MTQLIRKENVYGDSNFSIPLYQEGFLAPPDYIVSKHWARLFFPSGPAVQLEYHVQDSHLQCIQSQQTLVTHLLETPISRRHPIGRNVSFSLVFTSHSLCAGTNMNSWGEALDTLMHLRAGNSSQHLRLDGLKMVNFSDEVASGIVTSLKDSERRRGTAFELAKGPCIVARFSGNPRLYDILKHR